MADHIRAAVNEIQRILPAGTPCGSCATRASAKPSVGNVEALIEVLLTVLVVSCSQLVAIDRDHGSRPSRLRLASFIAVWRSASRRPCCRSRSPSASSSTMPSSRENTRHVDMGKDHYASFRGHGRLAAVAATTFSIVVVFVPIAFMAARPAMVRAIRPRSPAPCWFLFVSFSLDPMLSAWPDPHLPMAKRLISRSRPVQPLVQPAGRALQERHRLARPSLGDGEPGCRVVRGRVDVAGDGYSRRVLFPVTDESEFDCSKRRQLNLHTEIKAAETRGSRARSRRPSHPTRPSAGRTRRSTPAWSSSSSSPADRTRRQQAVDIRREVGALAG